MNPCSIYSSLLLITWLTIGNELLVSQCGQYTSHCGERTHRHRDYLSSEKGHKMGETFLAGNLLLAIEMKDKFWKKVKGREKKISNSIRTS